MNWFDEGNKLFNKKEYEKSLACYQKDIEVGPSSIEAWYNKALAHVICGEYEEGLEACETFIKAEIKDSEAWTLKGFALFHLKKYEEAVNALNEAINLNSESIYAWNNKGSALCNLGLWDDAIKSFQKAYSLDSRYLNALINKELALRYNSIEEFPGEIPGTSEDKKDLIERRTNQRLRGDYEPLPGLNMDLTPGVDMECPECGCGVKYKLRTKGQKCHIHGVKLVRAGSERKGV